MVSLPNLNPFWYYSLFKPPISDSVPGLQECGLSSVKLQRILLGCCKEFKFINNNPKA